jgi:hypothetical protein
MFGHKVLRALRVSARTKSTASRATAVEFISRGDAENAEMSFLR